MKPLTTITTTQLRTQSSLLIQTLLAGYPIQLTHRSQAVGIISPILGKPAQPFNTQRYLKLTKANSIPKLTPSQRAKKYHQSILIKHG